MHNHHRYLIFYSPYGVLSQFTASGNEKTLKDFHFPSRVYPVGRLDKDSEGLLLLSDDPRIVSYLLEGPHKHARSYYVQVEGIPDEKALRALRQGPHLGDFKAAPCQVELLLQEPSLPPRNPPIRFRQSIPTSWLKMTLWEGKNRQVRRMTAKIGYPTLRLVRFRIGDLTLENFPLRPGEWKDVDIKFILEGICKEDYFR